MKPETFISYHQRFYVLGLLLTVALIVFGLFYAKDLGINSDLKALLPESSSIVQDMDEISQKAASANDLRIVLSGGSFEQKLEAAEAFREFLLAREGLVRSVRFTSPKNFLEEHKFQLIPMSSLEEIHQEVLFQRQKHSDIVDPLGLEDLQRREQGEAPAKDLEREEIDLQQAESFLESINEMNEFHATEDGQYLALRVIPKVDSLDVQANKVLLQRFEALAEEFDLSRFAPEMQANVYGSIFNQVERYQSILRDLSVGGWGIFFIFIIVMVFFRSPWALLSLFPPLVAGVAFGTGMTAVLEGKLNVIAIFLVLVVFGLGVEFGIHLWARYLQERRKWPLREALVNTWRTTGRATVTSSVALLAGFALLTLSSFQGFAQFGRVAVILLAATALSFLFLMPSWIVLVEKLRRKSEWPQSFAEIFWKKAQSYSYDKKLPGTKIIRIVSFALALVAVPATLLFFRFDYTYTDETKALSNPPDRQALNDIFGGKAIKPSAVLVFDQEEKANLFLEAYETMSSEYPDIRQVSSLASFYPDDQEERIEKLQEIALDVEPSWIKEVESPIIQEALYELQEVAFDLETYSYSEIPEELIEPFETADASGDVIVYAYDIGGAPDGRKSMKFSDALFDLVERVELEALISGQELVLADVIRRVTGEGPWLIIGMFLLVFLICWLDFRKFRYAAVTVAPVFFGFLLTAFVLVLLDIDINFFNMVAIASLGAMVVDNSIHLFHRFLSLENRNEASSLRKAVYGVAPTIVACTFTSISGYFGMIVANHSGVASLGFAAALGLFMCLLSAVIIFPAWLELLEKPGQSSHQTQALKQEQIS